MDTQFLTRDEMTLLANAASEILDDIGPDIDDFDDMSLEDRVEIAFDAGRLSEFDPETNGLWMRLMGLAGYSRALYLVAQITP